MDEFLVFSEAEAVQYLDVVKGTFIFTVVMPATPATGDAKKFGLYSPNRDVGIYYEITGTTFRGVAANGDAGKSTTDDIVFDDSWVGVPVEFKIVWDAAGAKFYARGAKIAEVSFADDDLEFARQPLSLYVLNEDTDELLIGAIEVRDTYRYLQANLAT